MKRVIGCNSGYGAGGIGQHLAHMVAESRTAGHLGRYLAPQCPEDDAQAQVVPAPRWAAYVQACPPVRWSPAWRAHIGNEAYDRALAAALPPPSSSSAAYMGFVGTSLRTFRAARAAGYDRLELIAANSHVDNVAARHADAALQTGMHDTWLNTAQCRKTRAEYAAADAIYVHSEYVRQSFLEAGFPASRLIRTRLQPALRFQPPAERPASDDVHVVYVGRLDATKGLPLLVDAFARWRHPRARLTLVGGWGTPAMRRYMQAALRRDSRITVAPGDPLPVLHTADVFVHPSFEDGFGYAPAEALACGVPVIATADTGMAEYLVDGVNGYVVPTGDVDALVAHLDAVAARPLAATRSLWPEPRPQPVLAAG
mgnify:CR=1 FL=1